MKSTGRGEDGFPSYRCGTAPTPSAQRLPASPPAHDSPKAIMSTRPSDDGRTAPKGRSWQPYRPPHPPVKEQCPPHPTHLYHPAAFAERPLSLSRHMSLTEHSPWSLPATCSSFRRCARRGARRDRVPAEASPSLPKLRLVIVSVGSYSTIHVSTELIRLS